MAHHSVPGMSVAVISDYEIAWAKGYGVLQAGGGVPVTADTRFQAASITKPVVAVGALHYVEQGLLDLDENVNSRLVSWQVPDNEFTAQADVTLRRLLSHTAGINQGLFKGYGPDEDVPTMLQVLDGEPPATSPPVRVVRVPGSEEVYSNGGYVLVAQLLQDVVEKPFPVLMDDAVLAPAGMASSTFVQEVPEPYRATTAVPHGWDMEAWAARPGLVGQWRASDWSPGGLWATAPDLARFGVEAMRAYSGQSDAVLSQETARMMVEPVADGIPIQAPFEFSQALGFSVLHLGAEPWLIHFGGNFPGYISGILLQPDRGFGVVVMTNAWSGYELIWEVFYSVLYAYGILPTAGQAAGIVYSVVLSVAALTIWPVGGLAELLRVRRSASQTHRTQEGKVARAARIVLGLLVLGVLLLTLLYRGPLGGCLVVDLNTGVHPVAKGALGLFYALPLAVAALSVVVWRRKCWTQQRRVQYTLVAGAALLGTWFLRDLWPLMFWG